MMRPAAPEAFPLRAFQEGFADALLAPVGTKSASPGIARMVAQPGFAVYRNTVMKGCIDALQANYPAVARLVGDEWFRAAAALYVKDHLPAHPSLLDYGCDFPDFLATFEPARELPYLPGVARLDRFWTAAHVAGDAAALAADAVARLAPAQLAQVVLQPHPAARWAWFDTHPIATIWARNRVPETDLVDTNDDAPTLEWQAEGLLITRPHGRIEWVQLPAAGCAFLDACACGGTLADAAVAALAVDPQADLAQIMAGTLAAGAFCRLVNHADSATEPT